MVWRLNDDPWLFPDPHQGEPDGLLAVGGDLSPDRLLAAYSFGIFPWYGFRESPEIMWWCPMDRFVIFPSEVHVSHSMRQLIRSNRYTVSIGSDFNGVIEQCSLANRRNEQPGAWLGDEMKEAYKRLHVLGYATSFEVRDADSRLVGGLYGVGIGRSFIGESMFSLVPNASKLALIALAQAVEPHGGLIDCQFETAHLKSMGGRHIPYDEYMVYLRE